jgi:hypothetical protein
MAADQIGSSGARHSCIGLVGKYAVASSLSEKRDRGESETR